MRVHDHAFGIEELLEPQAIAGRAGAGRIVEGEHARLERGTEKPHSGQAWRLENSSGVSADYRETHFGDAVAERDRVSKDSAGAARHRRAREAVHDRLDSVSLLWIQLRYRIDFMHRAVDAHAHEALAGKLRDQRCVLALRHPPARQQQGQFALGREQRLIDHLAHGLRRQIDAVTRTAWQSARAYSSRR